LLKNSKDNSLLKKLFSVSPKRSKEDLELIRFIIDRFGYRPKNLSYFTIALTHKSLLTKKEYLASNERLEFLGDSILGSIIAEWVYHRFPNEDEGYLTQLKSKIVSRKVLSEIAEKLELRKVIRYQTGRSINMATIEGNSLEALFGAMYLDGGFEVVKSSILNHIFRKYIDVSRLLSEDTDFKSKLFILCQRNKWELEFLVLNELGNNSNRSYEIEVIINNEKYGTGVGNSKKEAEQVASKITLEQLDDLQ
jgi:ribonuclease-3